jgi:diguanylate cyclase (GGDEF)-like protein
MKRWMAVLAGWAMGFATALSTPASDGPSVIPKVPVTYAFKSYGTDQGLSNLGVVSLAMDPQGYLWVGTQDGLFRYDGRHFTRFHTLEGLPNPSVLRIQASADGLLWANTEGGLARGRDGHFEAVALGQGAERDTPRLALAVDRLGGAWVGGNAGLWYGRGAAALQKVGGLPAGPVNALWVDPEGKRVLVGRLGGFSYRGSDGIWRTRNLEGEFAQESPEGILMDKQGRIWIRSSSWLMRYATFDAKPEQLTSHLPATPSQWADLVEDWLGRVWAPTSQGVACFEGEGRWLLAKEQGLGLVGVSAVLVDPEGSLWIGSEGLHRLLGGMAWGTVGRKQGLPHDTIWSLFRTQAGAFFMGTHQGLAEFQAGRWTLVPDTTRRTFYAMAEDPTGGFWGAGSRAPRAETNSLLHRPRGGSFRNVPLPSVKVTVNGLVAASDGSFWLATGGDGLHHGRPGPKGLETRRESLPRETPRETIHVVLLDQAGLPLVSGSKGFVWWDGTAWHRMGKAEGLLDDHPGPMVLGLDGTLWLAYWDVHGLSRLRRKGAGWEVMEHLQNPPELWADSIYSLGVDAKGALWIGTAIGIRRWDGHRLRHFTHHDGLPGDDTSGNAFWADPNGDVWFGLTAGAACFDVRHAPADPLAPAARIGLFRDAADRRLPIGATPKLAYQDRAVRLEFSTTTFLHEDRLRPEVRLLGFEDHWRDSEGFNVRYTGLPPGTFTFEARVRTPEGLTSTPVTQTFTILPPWWRTWWAYGLGIGVLCGIIFLAVRWRTGFILRRMVELEALVQERTWNLEDANVALSKANGALEEASMVDPLTGLKNRRYLGLSLPEEIARVVRGYHQGGSTSMDHDLAFLLVDLDHFKAVNDTYGHGAGDAVLRQASAILRGVCRETDTVIRWGGEEFLIVAKAANRNQIEIIARNLCMGIRSHAFEVGPGVTIRKTCSVGFSAFPLVPSEPTLFRWEEAVEVADQCLYAAKHSGRDHYVGVWAPEDAVGAKLQPRLLSELSRVVAEGLLNLASSLQPGQPLIWK